MKVNLIDKMYRSTDFRVRYLDIVDLFSKILRKNFKNAHLFILSCRVMSYAR